MRRISISFTDQEYMVLGELARGHGGNLSKAVRSLLHSETVVNAIGREMRAAVADGIETVVTSIKCDTSDRFADISQTLTDQAASNKAAFSAIASALQQMLTKAGNRQ